MINIKSWNERMQGVDFYNGVPIAQVPVSIFVQAEITDLRTALAERDSVVANLQKAYDDLYAESTRDVTTLRSAATQALEASIWAAHPESPMHKEAITTLQSALGGPTT